MRAGYQVGTAAVVASVALAGLSAPAFGHVEVSADRTTAGAENVTLTFTGEAENPAAGIRSERVVVAPGVDPAGITLVKAPAGWTFTRAADGFTVAGKALKVGTDAVWKVRIAKLPDGQTRLSFKTLETYGNGDVSRWIEIQQAGQPEPDNPAPLLVLKPAPSAASPSAAPGPSTEPASSAAPTEAPTATTTPVIAPVANHASSTWWIWVVLAVLLVLALVVFQLRRRRRQD